MSSEEHFTQEPHNGDEQLVMEQERVDDERETSFQFERELRDAKTLTPTQAPAEEAERAPSDAAAAEQATAIAGAFEENTAQAVVVEDGTGASSGNKRSSRKSRASTSATSTSRPATAAAEAADGDQHIRKKSRKSVVTASAPDPNANVRLDRLRQALFRFLDLLSHRATPSAFAKALPSIDAESAEALRQQFVTQLKDAIIDESEKLISSNDLESKLASLHKLTQEADARYQANYAEGSEQLKDVWRKELDLETAISAKAIPDQERRVNELIKELDEVRKENASIHKRLLDTRTRSDAIQRDARDSLDSLESAIKGLEATPEMQTQLRHTMDDLLQDLGARV
ncbi:uncharacterized protein MEPE_04260 [Melanopsichium pennsylvanicum]|uniref:Uncharacterized protein n=2 Tax=Melanopsichium pennsylvanicum TaxID=63383 RepID=A0AAJ4XPH2_9BASI|nr:putative protein [Melanopsichium pennsylvanicum 4]SNX85551.1 uncharacterized protein MEPE_04260 [Melanopsichium pennsylvanicum]